MDFKKVVQTRRSIRKYSSKPIKRTILDSIFEMVRLSPSAENSQGWQFVVIDDPQKKEALTAQAFSGVFIMPWVKTAPVIVVMLSQKKLLPNLFGTKLAKIDYQCLDAGIAGEHLVLAAQNHGISTCWLGWFNKEKVRTFLNIPKNYEIYSLFTLGYKANDYEPREQKRKPIEDVVSYNEFKK